MGNVVGPSTSGADAKASTSQAAEQPADKSVDPFADQPADPPVDQHVDPLAEQLATWRLSSLSFPFLWFLEQVPPE